MGLHPKIWILLTKLTTLNQKKTLNIRWTTALEAAVTAKKPRKTDKTTEKASRKQKAWLKLEDKEDTTEEDRITSNFLQLISQMSIN